MSNTRTQDTAIQRLRTAKQLWFRIVNAKLIKSNYEMPASLEKELKDLRKKGLNFQYKYKCETYFKEKISELRSKYHSRKVELQMLCLMERANNGCLDASFARCKKHLLDLEEVDQLEVEELDALQKKEFLEHLYAVDEYFRLNNDSRFPQYDRYKNQTALLRKKWQNKKSYDHAKTILENGHSARKVSAKIKYYQEAKSLFANLSTFSDSAYYKENARYHLAKSFVKQGDEAQNISAKNNAYRDAQEIFADLIAHSQYYHKDDTVIEHRDTVLYRWGICFIKMADQANSPHHKANYYVDALERFSLIQSREKQENLPFHEDTARLRWVRCRLNTEDPEMQKGVRTQLKRLLDHSLFYKKEAQQYLDSFAQKDEAARVVSARSSSKSLFVQGFFKLVSKVEMLSPISLKKEPGMECRF